MGKIQDKSAQFNINIINANLGGLLRIRFEVEGGKVIPLTCLKLVRIMLEKFST